MKKSFLFLWIVCASFMILGCTAAQPEPKQLIKFDMTATNYLAAQKLLADAKLSSGTTIIMATVVNIDEIEKSSTFGRLVSEHIASYAAQSGMGIVEMKFRENVYMKQHEGELMLTREISKIARNHSAEAVIVGTYAVADSAVYVTLKMVDPSTNRVIAASDYTLPLNHDLAEMVGKKVRLF